MVDHLSPSVEGRLYALEVQLQRLRKHADDELLRLAVLAGRPEQANRDLSQLASRVVADMAKYNDELRDMTEPALDARLATLEHKVDRLMRKHDRDTATLRDIEGKVNELYAPLELEWQHRRTEPEHTSSSLHLVKSARGRVRSHNRREALHLALETEAHCRRAAAGSHR